MRAAEPIQGDHGHGVRGEQEEEASAGGPLFVGSELERRPCESRGGRESGITRTRMATGAVDNRRMDLPSLGGSAGKRESSAQRPTRLKARRARTA